MASIGNSIGESWAFYWFGAAVESALLVLIIRSAWSWQRSVPSTPELATAGH
jgi:hypothetical protein